MFPEGRILEFVIVGAVALMVVGPKDLPVLMRRFGQFVARMRGMAAEFRASFDEIARQSELDELRREVEAMRASVSVQGVASRIVGTETVQTFDEINAGLTQTPSTESGASEPGPSESEPLEAESTEPCLPFPEVSHRSATGEDKAAELTKAAT